MFSPWLTVIHQLNSKNLSFRAVFTTLCCLSGHKNMGKSSRTNVERVRGSNFKIQVRVVDDWITVVLLVIFPV